jgi:hypothetical protein
LHSASKVYQVKEITKGTNPSDNNKSQAIEIGKGTNSSLKSIKSKELRVFHQNIRGLRNTPNEIKSAMHTNRPHILCLTEPHMKPLELEHIRIENYNLGATYC